MEFFDHSKEGLIAAVEPDKELEIKEKERLLHHIQEDIDKEKKKQSELQHELCRVNKKMCLIDEDISVCTRDTVDHQKAIERHVTKIKSLELAIQGKKKVFESQNRQKSVYLERVDTHKRKVSEFVEKLCVTQELNEAQAKWEKTKEKSGDLNLIINKSKHLDVRVRTVELQITETIARKKEMEKDIKTMQVESQVMNESIQRLQNELDLLRKRKQARLVRLRHQLHEGRQRNRQLHIRAAELRTHIEKAKRKLKEKQKQC